MKKFVKSLPVIGSLAQSVYRLARPATPFSNTVDYWKSRYAAGGNSGDGSYGDLASFKAEVLNRFVAEHAIRTVIEYGCGDGNQLTLARYPSYLGFDISPAAIDLCRAKFRGDGTKAFKLVPDYAGERAQLTLSLDVVYHLIEDDLFTRYFERLFDSADDFVIVYSTDTDDQAPGQAAHVCHRQFTRWVKAHRPHWKLHERIPNRYPYDPATGTGSDADFFIFAREDRP